MKRFIILLAIPLLVQSCSSIYIPANRSIPLLEKKGEFQGEAGVSTNSVYVNGSYAFTDDIAVSINGNLSYGNFTNRYDLFTHKDAKEPTGFFEPDLRGMFAHRYGEVSVGKINILPEFPMKLEIFGGAGMGRATDIVSNSRYNHNGNYKTDYYSFFGQGNLGLKKQKVEVGASVRIAYSMFDYTYNLNNINNEYFFQTRFSNVSLEPMLFARVGGENLKAVLKIGLNLMPKMSHNEESLWDYRGLSGLGYTIFHFSIGLRYRLNR